MRSTEVSGENPPEAPQIQRFSFPPVTSTPPFPPPPPVLPFLPVVVALDTLLPSSPSLPATCGETKCVRACFWRNFTGRLLLATNQTLILFLFLLLLIAPLLPLHPTLIEQVDVMMKPRPVHHAYIAHQHGDVSRAFKSSIEDDATSSSMQTDMVDAGAWAGSKGDEGASVEESTFSRKRGGDSTPSMDDGSSDRLFDPFFSRKRSCESNAESDGRSVSPTIRHQNASSRGGSAWSSNSHSSWGSVGPLALELVSSFGSGMIQTFQSRSGSSSPVVFPDSGCHHPPGLTSSASSMNRGSPVSRLSPDRNSDASHKSSSKHFSTKLTSNLAAPGGKTMMRRRSFTEQLAKGETLLNVDERWELKSNAGRGVAMGLGARQGSVEPTADGTMPNSRLGLSSGIFQGSAPPCMPSPTSASDKMQEGFLLGVPKDDGQDSEGRGAS